MTATKAPDGPPLRPAAAPRGYRTRGGALLA